MKPDNKNISLIKTVIILLSVTLISFLLTALIFAFPKITANKKLNSLEKLITSAEVDEIIIYQHTPFESGTFEQVTSALEKKLTDVEVKEFTDRFLSAKDSLKYVGVSEGYYGMTDYKIVITHGGTRTVFYVSKDSVYILEKRMKTDFKCENNPLYEYLNSVKQSYFEES